MPSLEQVTKEQFAKVFATNDWKLFKELADINFAEAAVLKMSALQQVPQKRRLLVRNVRKRLLIGIGTELLVKAVYLKSGYCINRPQDSKLGPKFPFRLADLGQAALYPGDTFTLAQLTDHLRKIVEFPNPDVVLSGLRVAKVFRNKEGHVVTSSHTFDPSSYRAIEVALVDIYGQVFSQRLTVHFSFAHGEKGAWRVAL